MLTRKLSLLQLFVFSLLVVSGFHIAHAGKPAWHSLDLSIDYAYWDEQNQALTLSGTDKPRSRVNLYASGTTYLLTSVTTDNRGRWRESISNPSVVPCILRAEDDGSSVDKEVSFPPSDCLGADSLSSTSDALVTDPIVTDPIVQNNPPEISGTPDTSVAEGTSYYFAPNASDPDGDPLSFSIVNQPAWASFNTSTGALSGVPGTHAAGSYENIQISVSDGSASASLGAFSITVLNTNQAPSISGTPAPSVEEGSSYNFSPIASDPDGDPLRFSITNLPGWAGFSPTDGTLSGTPGSADIGLYDNIVITVSDGTATASLGPISISVTQGAATTTGSANISWVAPVARTDGSPLTLSEISGYEIYLGTSPDTLEAIDYLNNSSMTEYVADNLSAGTYYFSVTAKDNDGRESAFSDVVEKIVGNPAP